MHARRPHERRSERPAEIPVHAQRPPVLARRGARGTRPGSAQVEGKLLAEEAPQPHARQRALTVVEDFGQSLPLGHGLPFDRDAALPAVRRSRPQRAAGVQVDGQILARRPADRDQQQPSAASGPGFASRWRRPRRCSSAATARSPISLEAHADAAWASRWRCRGPGSGRARRPRSGRRRRHAADGGAADERARPTARGCIDRERDGRVVHRVVAAGRKAMAGQQQAGEQRDQDCRDGGHEDLLGRVSRVPSTR
ncbi:hypothetical protein Ddc_19409 [Ditylenchus destructor]|nr:hypothetical protein Ddc_19409 [Ditylenchus destructor]